MTDPTLAHVIVLDEQAKEHIDPLPPRSVFTLAGSVVWRAPLEESVEKGMHQLPIVRESLGIAADTPLFGYCVSKKMNKGYSCRTERMIREQPDSYHDESADHFVEHYFEPLLMKEGKPRPIEDITKDMRLNFVIHSYNEFGVMVENALRDKLAADGFSRADQKRIMSQVFMLELGCNGQQPSTSPELPGFMHMQVYGVKDERLSDIDVAQRAVASGTPLWGNPQDVSLAYSAAAQLAPNRIAMLVETPLVVHRGGKDHENAKGHNVDGYLMQLPPQARAMIRHMMTAETLPPSFELPGVVRDAAPATSEGWRERHEELAATPPVGGAPHIG